MTAKVSTERLKLQSSACSPLVSSDCVPKHYTRCRQRRRATRDTHPLLREKSITKGENMALDGGGERGKGGESQGGGSDAVGAQRKGTSSGIGKPESFKKEMIAKMRPREQLGVDHRAWGKVFQRGNSTW